MDTAKLLVVEDLSVDTTKLLVVEDLSTNIPKILMAVSGGVGALVAYVTSWSPHIGTLLILMIIDFVFGLLTPIIVGKSKKDASGKISSKVCRRGIVKKCVVFLLIYVAWLLGKEAGFLALTEAVVMGFIISETISILENAAVLGVPIPKVFLKLLKVMNEKASAGIDLLANGEVSKDDASKLTLEIVRKDAQDAQDDGSKPDPKLEASPKIGGSG